MAAIYCPRGRGRRGLRRLDAVRIFEQLADAAARRSRPSCPSTTWCALDDRHATAPTSNASAWVPRLASMEADRQLLPDRAGRRVGRGGADARRPSATATSYVLDGVKQFISGRRRSDVYVVMARTGDDGAAGISAFIVEKDTPGLSFRREREEDGLERPAHRAGHLRGRPGAGRRDAASAHGGHRLPDRDERAQRRPAQHRGVLARRRAGRTRQGASPTWPSARRSAAHCSTSQTVRFRLADMAHRAGDVANAVVAGGRCARRRGAPDKVRVVRDGEAVRHRRLLRGRRTRRCSCTAATAISREYGLEKIVRDLRVHQILEGNQRNHARGHRPRAVGGRG